MGTTSTVAGNVTGTTTQGATTTVTVAPTSANTTTTATGTSQSTTQSATGQTTTPSATGTTLSASTTQTVTGTTKSATGTTQSTTQSATGTTQSVTGTTVSATSTTRSATGTTQTVTGQTTTPSVTGTTQTVTGTTASASTTQSATGTTQTVTGQTTTPSVTGTTQTVTGTTASASTTQTVTGTTQSATGTTQTVTGTTQTVTGTTQTVTGTTQSASTTQSATGTTQTVTGTTVSATNTTQSATGTTQTVTGQTTTQSATGTTQTVTGTTPSTSTTQTVTGTTQSATGTTQTVTGQTTTVSASTIPVSGITSVSSAITSTGSTSTSSPNATTAAPTTATVAPTTTMAPTTTTTAGPTTTPCIGSPSGYPVMPSNPTITYSPQASSIRFDCKAAATNETGSLYSFVWTSASGTNLRTTNLGADVITDSLNSADLQQAARDSIISSGLTCRVQVSNPARCGNTQSPYKATTFGATKLTLENPTKSTLKCGEESTVRVRYANSATTPDVYCKLRYGKACAVNVEVRTQQTQPWKCIGGSPVNALSVRSLSTSTDVCGTQLQSASQDVTLRATVDNIFRSLTNVNVELYQIDKVDGVERNRTFIITHSLNVDSCIEQVSTCRVYGDPHIRTFDGQSYDVMRPGIYRVYKHKELDLEVIGYFSRTGNGASACGFGIRSGDDVIRISKCYTPMATKLYLNGELTPNTKIFQQGQGNKIKVLLPTGTLITVIGSGSASNQESNGILQLEIRPSAIDFGKTEGLCGIYDGSTANDLTGSNGNVFTLRNNVDPNDFSGSWSVSQEDSLYGGFNGAQRTSFSEVYCGCESGQATCTAYGFVAECGISQGANDITQDLISDYLATVGQQVTLPSRRRRQTTTPTEVFVFDDSLPVYGVVQFPTPSGMTVAEARTKCTNTVKNSPAYSPCTIYSADDFNTEVNNCVRDIGVTGITDWDAAHLQNIQLACGTEVATNSSLWQDPNPGTASANASLPTATVATLCPNQCSRNGQCINGECSCNAGYADTDCSQSVNILPTVIAQGSNTLCQNNVAACNRTVVHGENFFQPKSMYCHITPIQVHSEGITILGSALIGPASWRSQYEVLCNLPQEKQSYSIRISRDRQSVSTAEALFVSYNAQCNDCVMSSNTSSATCSSKAQTCFIESMCYIHGQPHPTDQCKACTAESATAWSPNYQGAGCNFQSTPSTTTKSGENDQSRRFDEQATIIGASIGAIVAVLLFVGVVVYCVRRSQRSRMKDSVSTSEGGSDTNRLANPNSNYERVYNGNYGVLTHKTLGFRNPTHIYDYYEPTL